MCRRSQQARSTKGWGQDELPVQIQPARVLSPLDSRRVYVRRCRSIVSVGMRRKCVGLKPAPKNTPRSSSFGLSTDRTRQRLLPFLAPRCPDQKLVLTLLGLEMQRRAEKSRLGRLAHYQPRSNIASHGARASSDQSYGSWVTFGAFSCGGSGSLARESPRCSLWP